MPDYESIIKFLAEEKRWPINETWALHDFTFYMNGPANSYLAALKNYRKLDFEPVPNPGQKWGQNPALTARDDPGFLAYKKSVYKLIGDLGKELTLKEFARLAQMINYEHHRALSEGLAVKRSSGLLMWMSQSAYPSFMWQTYDYFLATNGGYFGVKAGCRPTRAVLDPRSGEIVLANFTPKTYRNVTTACRLYDLNGKLFQETLYITELLGPDTYGLVLGRVDCMLAPTDLVFVKLTVRDEKNNILGENLYWHNYQEYQNYRALSGLPAVGLTAQAAEKKLACNSCGYTVAITNNSGTPALQVRIRTLSSTGGQDVLPVFYSDNYFTLLPGDSKTVTLEFNPKNLQGDEPVFHIDGFNVAALSCSPC